MSDDLTGFLPSMQSIQISESNQMITTDGDLISAHSVRLRLRDGSDIVFSVTEEELQKLFFVLLKALS
jgi:hypothetical protein